MAFCDAPVSFLASCGGRPIPLQDASPSCLASWRSSGKTERGPEQGHPSYAVTTCHKSISARARDSQDIVKHLPTLARILREERHGGIASPGFSIALSGRSTPGDGSPDTAQGAVPGHLLRYSPTSRPWSDQKGGRTDDRGLHWGVLGVGRAFYRPVLVVVVGVTVSSLTPGHSRGPCVGKLAWLRSVYGCSFTQWRASSC